MPNHQHLTLTTLISLTIAAGAACTAPATAETLEVATVGYGITTKADQIIEMRNGVTVATGGNIHFTRVDKAGTVSSQWCSGSSYRKGETPMGAIGHCTSQYENGELLHIWYRFVGLNQSEWGVLGGTGRFEGASGGGTSENVTFFPDGTWTARSKGNIELP